MAALLLNAPCMAAPVIVIPPSNNNAVASTLIQKQQDDNRQTSNHYNVMQQQENNANDFNVQAIKVKSKSFLVISTLPSMQNVNKEVAESVEVCENRRRSAVLKNHVQSVKCSNPHIISYFKTAEYPYMDIIGQYTKQRLLVAKKLDKNKMTEEEAKLELDKFIRSIHSEEQGRGISVESY